MLRWELFAISASTSSRLLQENGQFRFHAHFDIAPSGHALLPKGFVPLLRKKKNKI